MTEHMFPKRYQSLLTWLILGAGLLTFVAYHMPWHIHPLAAFSNNGFDLAEWMSLHPSVRTTQIEATPFLTVWLLRVVLLPLAMIITIHAARLQDERWRWIWRGVALLIILRLNPPIDFYRGVGLALQDKTPTTILVQGWIFTPNVDPNGLMLGNLMMSGMVMVVILTLGARWLKHLVWPLTLIACGYMLYAADRGYEGANEAIASFQLPIEIGGGYTLFRVFVVIIGGLATLEFLLAAWKYLQSWQHRPVQSQVAIE